MLTGDLQAQQVRAFRRERNRQSSAHGRRTGYYGLTPDERALHNEENSLMTKLRKQGGLLNLEDADRLKWLRERYMQSSFEGEGAPSVSPTGMGHQAATHDGLGDHTAQASTSGPVQVARHTASPQPDTARREASWSASPTAPLIRGSHSLPVSSRSHVNVFRPIAQRPATTASPSSSSIGQKRTLQISRETDETGPRAFTAFQKWKKPASTPGQVVSASIPSTMEHMMLSIYLTHTNTS